MGEILIVEDTPQDLEMFLGGSENDVVETIR